MIPGETLETNVKDEYNYYFPRHEFDLPKPIGSPNVLGRLKARISQWERMGAPKFILDTLSTGYKLPLIDTPQPRYFKNNKSALRNQDFVTHAIDELLSSGRKNWNLPLRSPILCPFPRGMRKNV
jgi:hypothetical protein